MAEICIVLSSMEDIREIKTIKEKVLIELRLDLLEIPVEEIPELMKISNHWMVSIREKLFEKPDAEKLILAALSQRPRYLDIDENCLNKPLIVNLLQNLSPNIKRIYSYHNFEFTPDFSILNEKAENLFRSGADIVKVACLGTKAADLKTIEKLYDKFPNLIAFLMGDEYKNTRFIALTKGAGLSYASMNEKHKTAPGQLIYQEMKDFLEQNKIEHE
ncbi:MAG: type I 3-dehydroquinate dehydratase [Bacteroidales bacterium]|nr:type I 3-dehydroquinate dehydratase [Bacteroidales bacterium]MDY0217590.1 type I 3-dehydroquinate dehydratase [Bacteroidales bacterium]